MSTERQSLKPTHVVTCFLMRHDLEQPYLLLVQRSGKVGTYHNRWAGISGFVEPGVTPDEQAYTEINEETCLRREQVKLQRRGSVVEHIDAEVGRHFYVHPFLFDVLTPEHINTDWEAVDMRWVAPVELTNYETVPKLIEAYDAAAEGEVVS